MKKIMTLLDKIVEYFTQIKENFTQSSDVDNECNYYFIALITIVVLIIALIIVGMNDFLKKSNKNI